MPTIHLSANVSSEELLEALKELPARELDAFVHAAIALRRRAKRRRVPGKEAELLAEINKGFAASWWAKYQNLIEKRCAESLTESEERKLIQFSNQLEKRQVKRLTSLAELARLRGVTLSALMTDLGLPAAGKDA